MAIAMMFEQKKEDSLIVKESKIEGLFSGKKKTGMYVRKGKVGINKTGILRFNTTLTKSEGLDSFKFADVVFDTKERVLYLKLNNVGGSSVNIDNGSVMINTVAANCSIKRYINKALGNSDISGAYHDYKIEKADGCTYIYFGYKERV